MYSVIIFLMFLVTSFLSIYISGQFVPNLKGGAHEVFFVIGCIGYVITVITFFILAISNMERRKEMKEAINEVKTKKKRLAINIAL